MYLNKTISIVGLGMIGACQQAVCAQERPNIVLIMADDMGYSDIGCYGGEIPTPHIDSLASHGARTPQLSNTSRSCPTRARLMTGLSQHRRPLLGG